MGEAADAAATPTAETAACQQQFAGRGSMVWSVLTDPIKRFGQEATTPEFSKKLLKWKADVGG